MNSYQRLVRWCQKPSMIKVNGFHPTNFRVAILSFSIILSSSFFAYTWYLNNMSVIARILELETFGSYIRRYLLGMLPDPLPMQNIIEYVYVVTEPRLNAIVIGSVFLGCLIGASLTFVFRRNRGSEGKAN